MVRLHSGHEVPKGRYTALLKIGEERRSSSTQEFGSSPSNPQDSGVPWDEDFLFGNHLDQDSGELEVSIQDHHTLRRIHTWKASILLKDVASGALRGEARPFTLVRQKMSGGEEAIKVLLTFTWIKLGA